MDGQSQEERKRQGRVERTSLEDRLFKVSPRPLLVGVPLLVNEELGLVLGILEGLGPATSQPKKRRQLQGPAFERVVRASTHEMNSSPKGTLAKRLVRVRLRSSTRSGKTVPWNRTLSIEEKGRRVIEMVGEMEGRSSCAAAF